MRCPLQTDNSEILLNYCSRKLSAEVTAMLERHIPECAECTRFASGQKLLWETLDSWEAMPISADFDRKLYARIEEHERSSWWHKLLTSEFFQPFGWRPAMPLVTACLTFAVAVFLYIPSDKPVPATVNSQQRVETVDVDQAERAIEDMEMLRQLAPPPSAQKL